ARAHRNRRHHGYAQLHGPRAGRRQEQGCRPVGRHLRAWSDSLRSPDRPATVHWQQLDGRGPQSVGRGANSATTAGEGDSGGSRSHLLEVLTEGAGEALWERRGVGRRHASVPGRSTYPGATRGASGTCVALVSALPGGGVARTAELGGFTATRC